MKILILLTLYFIGVNDQFLFSENKKDRNVDKLTEGSKKAKIREYLESNSFFYKQFRILKSTLYLKFGFNKGVNQVNKKTVVYHEIDNDEFRLVNAGIATALSIDKTAITITNSTNENPLLNLFDES